MLIDSHVHLYDHRYKQDLNQVIARAVENNIHALIIPGTDPESSKAAIDLAEQHNSADCAIFAAVGIHPTDAHTLTPDILAELDKLAAHPRVVAIGEIGLDYYWIHNTKRTWRCATVDEQTSALYSQLDLAKKHNLPVILHDRDAHDDIITTIENWLREYPLGKGTFHAYAGGTKHLERVLNTGMCIGIDGPVTFKNAHSLRQVAETAPLDRLLLETDGPYLTPSPHRGKRNEPAYIPLIRNAIAAARDCPAQDVESASTANAIQLFNLPVNHTPMV